MNKITEAIIITLATASTTIAAIILFLVIRMGVPLSAQEMTTCTIAGTTVENCTEYANDGAMPSVLVTWENGVAVDQLRAHRVHTRNIDTTGDSALKDFYVTTASNTAAYVGLAIGTYEITVSHELTDWSRTERSDPVIVEVLDEGDTTPPPIISDKPLNVTANYYFCDHCPDEEPPPVDPPDVDGVFFSDNFESYNGSLDKSKWDGLGSAVSLVKEGNNQYLRVSYDAPGTAKYIVNKTVANLNLKEIYIKLRWKRSGEKSGSKFIKLFGKGTENNYANGTFITDYNSGNHDFFTYGNGDTQVNDTQRNIRYDGTRPPEFVVINKATDKFNAVNDEWHVYQAYMKYNSDDKRDGVIKVWIDGELRLHATNVKNRHNANIPEFQQVRLADYTSSSKTWSLSYDDVQMSTEFIPD